MVDARERGREAYRRRAWGQAYVEWTSAATEAALAGEDLERLATVCALVGRDESSDEVWARAHQQYVEDADLTGAARCAFWLAFGLLHRGEMAKAQGWLARAARLVRQCGSDCVERGLLLIPMGLQQFAEGDPAAACASFDDAIAIGEEFGAPDLLNLGRLGRGQALIGLGRASEGIGLLDEVMVAVTRDEVSPIASGVIYCAVIETCRETFDPRRAREWTTALGDWCDAQPDLVPFRGQCLVHRSEVLQYSGDWTGALSEANRACELLAGGPAEGAALYQRAEMHRGLGELTEAEVAYRRASHWGRNPQPGLALLRVAQGRVSSAVSTIIRALEEADDVPSRLHLLPAAIEIHIAARDAVAARAAADELTELAAQIDAPMVHAVARTASGAVSLAEGDARSAAVDLRDAATRWRDLEAPYEVGRARALLGRAIGALGDDDSAELEFAAAREIFERLGAAHDARRLTDVTGPKPVARPAGLSEREVEVLVLLAAGETNRAIATHLTISSHTVARHVQNIFAKIGVSTRAAAGAFAFEHDLT